MTAAICSVASPSGRLCAPVRVWVCECERVRVVSPEAPRHPFEGAESWWRYPPGAGAEGEEERRGGGTRTLFGNFLGIIGACIKKNNVKIIGDCFDKTCL